MHIVTVDKFLCCFRLETGGYVLGWLGTIFTSIGILVLTAVGVFISFNYEMIHQAIKNGTETMIHEAVNNETVTIDTQIDSWALDLLLNGSAVVLLVILVVVVAVMLIYLFTFVFLIIGTKNRNSSRLVPYLILEAISIILGFVQLASLNWQSAVNVVVSTIINGYFYICIYSLYVKLRQEKKYKFPKV